MDRFQAMLGLSPRTTHLLREGLMRRFGEDMMTRFSAETMARDIDLPALIIHDRDDRDIPWQDGELLANAWPRAQFVSTSGLGHRRILRDPEVIDRVVRFVSSNPARAAAPVGAAAAGPLRRWD
jgi:pimeloyl-ACP methyl ester carboxylesterase